MKTSADKSAAKKSTPSAQRADQPFFAKAGGGEFFATVDAPPAVQTKMSVNKPGDGFEQEADRMADKVMRMSAPVQGPGEEKLQRAPEEKLQKKDDEKLQGEVRPEEKVQRRGDGAPAVQTGTQSAIQSKLSGGQQLSGDVRGFMEPRFGADFSSIRVHNDPESARLNNQLSARAFAYQNHIFFSRDQYQPGTSDGRQLLAHELTHTIQQGHAVRRTPQVSVSPVQPHIQRSVVGDVLDWFADKANYIPGFRMFTLILGVNPINMSSVDRSAANILRALIEFMPGGAFITRALDNHGVFNKVASWAETQIRTLGMVGSMFKQSLSDFIDSLGWRDLLPWHWGDVWDRAKRIFTTPIDRLISFAVGLVRDIIKFIKDAILKPLAALAQGTRGYDLLKAVLGEDPITGEPVPRTADNLIGGFMKFIGKEDIWENIKKGHAIPRAWAWFQGALSGLMGLVRSIPQRIVDTISSLTIEDIITVAGAFSKIFGLFGGIVGDFLGWGLKQVISLLEILFSVVAPGVMPYLTKAKTAFTTILNNPVGFIGNLVRAGKLGFTKFKDNIVDHLKNALIKWLTGPLGDAGVYIPKSFDLVEIIKLVLSVLGLTWANIRSKLVKIIPEPVLVGLEKTAGVLVTLVKDGPVAAWEQIKAELTDLKDQLIAHVTEMISVEIVKAAVVKLVSMLNPAGAVIQAILGIYNTIMFFVQKINQIAEVVASFIDSISAIAAGQVENAAKKVERTMANTLTVVLGFLAKFAGLGNVPEKLVGIVKKIRQPIDKGLDKIVEWLGNILKKLVGAVKSGVSGLLEWWKKKVPVEGGGEKHILTFEGDAKSAMLVLRSIPEKPSVFLTSAAERKKVDAAKRKKPIATAETHEKEVESLQSDLRRFDEKPGPAAAGKDADKADVLAGKLDTKLTALGTHIVTTLDDWGVSDAVIKGVNLPRGSFTVEQKRGIAAQHKDKSDLRKNSEGERINLAKGLARRHVVSSYDMSRHYADSLNGKKISEGKLLLEQRGSIAEARTPVESVSQKGIQEAATTRYSRFFGYLKNMFIGDSRENSSIQEYLDKGNPEMAGRKLDEHVRHVKRAWALDDNIQISGLDQQ